jgi:hypothetical protein
MRQVTPAPAKTTEIEVEPEPERESAEALVPTVQVPQAVLDAVAEADATQAEVGTVDEAEVATPEPAAETPAPEPPPETASPEAPAAGGAAPSTSTPETAADATPEAPETDEEVSLEAILEDLKRREGRAE